MHFFFWMCAAVCKNINSETRWWCSQILFLKHSEFHHMWSSALLFTVNLQQWWNFALSSFFFSGYLAASAFSNGWTADMSWPKKKKLSCPSQSQTLLLSTLNMKMTCSLHLPLPKTPHSETDVGQQKHMNKSFSVSKQHSVTAGLAGVSGHESL